MKCANCNQPSIRARDILPGSQEKIISCSSCQARWRTSYIPALAYAVMFFAAMMEGIHPIAALLLAACVFVVLLLLVPLVKDGSLYYKIELFIFWTIILSGIVLGLFLW